MTACTGSDDAAPTSTASSTTSATSTSSNSTASNSTASNSDPQVPFETLPPAGAYRYPSDAETIVARISSRVPFGPAVPVLTIYGDRRVIAGTTAGWYQGRLADGDIQLFLGDAASVGLLDDELSLRGPDNGPDADVTVTLDVDGVRRDHEFDLSQIERPVALRVFFRQSAVDNRFGLTDPFDPGQWLACDEEGCTINPAPTSATDRPVLPGEDPDELLDQSSATGR